MHQDPHPHQHPEVVPVTAEEMAEAALHPPDLPVPPAQLVLPVPEGIPAPPVLPAPPARLVIRGPQDLPGLATPAIPANPTPPATQALATTPDTGTEKEAAKTRNDT